MVVRRQVDEYDEKATLALVREYSGTREQADLVRAREGELKRRLSEIVEKFGEEDEKGHLRLDLPDSTGGYVALQRQRRVSRTLDEDSAAKILAATGLTDKCYRLEPVLDQDAVMACLYDGSLSESQIDEMFPQRVSFAFVPMKG